MSETERRIERLVESGSIPHRGDDPVFDEPWQARAFGLVLSLCDDGTISWDAFQRRLVEEVAAGGGDDDPETAYYEQWLRAFERLLEEDGVVSAADRRERATEFADGRRDASEFVHE